MEHVRERWLFLEGAGHASLLARVDHVQRHIDDAARVKAHDAARKAQSTVGKVAWLRADAENVLKAARPVSGCKRGCGHCCHIGVTVAKAEAEVIGRSIGRKVASPPPERVLDVADMIDSPDSAERMAKMQKQQAWMRDEYHGTPCTFLDRHGSCTIYESRPLICRWQINMDVDALLCELVPQGIEAPRVPYLNMTDMHTVYAQRFMGSPLADVRDWFPRKGAA